jgi:hypothetical protein
MRQESSPQLNAKSSVGSISAAYWAKAVKKLMPIESSVQGVKETIWASGSSPKCEGDCVAHCIAGQPRNFFMPGLRKALKHRLFERFSDSRVVFGVFVTSPYTNDKLDAHGDGRQGVARNEVLNFTDFDGLTSDMEEVGVDRALLLYESCYHPSCMENPALQCDARDLGLLEGFDPQDGKVHHICDVQLRRFQTCMNMVTAYEHERNVKFAWVTRSRPDVYWTKPVAPARTLDQNVYFHDWEGAYGGFDWFYAVPRTYADAIARFPDEASCSQLHHPEIQKFCKTLGCECWLASWLLKQSIPFKALPGNGIGSWKSFVPVKFCSDDCPRDWEVTAASIENKRDK